MKHEKKPKKPSLKQYNESLLKSIEHLQKELATLSNDNYHLKRSLESAERERDTAREGRRNAESMLAASEATGVAWRAAFYAVVLKQGPHAAQGTDVRGAVKECLDYGVSQPWSMGR